MTQRKQIINRDREILQQLASPSIHTNPSISKERLQVLEKQREHKLKYGRFNPNMMAAKKSRASIDDQYQVNTSGNILLPPVESLNNYKTLEIQAMLDRSRSVDPNRKLLNNIPRQSPLQTSANKKLVSAQYSALERNPHYI